jgi:NAD(P)-dependent dehydrogenase (short-subunit alcohol dehydrogenase family)
MTQSKVSIVTGGGQGIGKAIAQRFMRDGMAVVLAETDEEAGHATERELRETGTVRFVHADVGNEADVQALMLTTVGDFGRLDVLINNAGISRNGPMTELNLQDWDRVLRVNLTGAFLCAKHAAPHLQRARGAIINIASTRALMSEPNTEAYSASKGGLIALTHALAISLGPTVRVNAISPGWIDVSAWKKPGRAEQTMLRPEDHAQHPTGRVGRPDDVAGLAAYLVSDEASFITGQNFVIDGGMTHKMIYV